MSTKQNDETQSRWYMVNKDGMVTLCADHAHAKQRRELCAARAGRNKLIATKAYWISARGQFLG